MRTRHTARVLLFSPEGRLLLVKFEDNATGQHPIWWATVGGGLDPGEDVMAGARREAFEETGLSDLAFGPAVWTGEHVLRLHGEPVRFFETFVVAHAAHEALDDSGWTEWERECVREMRWWDIGELAASDEIVFPPLLKTPLLADIAAGRYPDGVLTVELGDTE